MFTLELSVLLTLFAAFAGVSLAGSLRSALAKASAIRQALADCPEQRVLRYVIRETVVTCNDGKVVPFGPRRTVSLPMPQPARAAA